MIAYFRAASFLSIWCVNWSVILLFRTSWLVKSVYLGKKWGLVSLIWQPLIHTFIDICKGQLISKCPLRVIVWNKIPSKFFSRISALASKKRLNKKRQDFDFTSWQKSWKNVIGILVQTMIPKGHLEINWPLASFIWCRSFFSK